MRRFLLARASRRELARHPWQAGLSILGVAMGVAVVVGIDLANSSAERAFRLGVESVAGRATHQISAAGPGGLDDALYVHLRRDLGLRGTAPIVEGDARLAVTSGRSVRLLGIDPFAEPPFRSFTAGLGSGWKGGDLGAFLTRPGAVVLGRELAAALTLTEGARFGLQVGGQRHELEVVGLLEADDDLARQALNDLLIVDIATAQELLDQTGRLSRIDLVLPGGAAGEAQLETVREALPAAAILAPRAARSGALAEMTRAFRLNLTALSLLALLVGMFLIYNTMTFSVVRRRALIGVLRAMGVTRREIFALVLSEAALIGLLGTAIGLGLGTLLAQGLLALVVRTINDLYFALSVGAVVLAPAVLIKGTVLGLGATLLAALAPAREATSASPTTALARSHLEKRAHRAAPRLLVVGLVLAALAGGLLLIPGRSLGLSFAAVFVVVLAFACAVPMAVIAASRLLGPPMRAAFGVLGAMAARGVAAALSRTGVAVAALVIAVAMTIGVALMVRSFRLTLIDWLQVTLQADIYVSPTDLGARGALTALDSATVRVLSEAPGVAYATTYRRVRVDAPQGLTQLVAMGMERAAFEVLTFASGTPDAVWEGWQEEQAVIVSESYAYHHDLAVGSTLTLYTDRGAQDFNVAGVFYDYASDRGIVIISRDTYDRYWDDDAVQSLGLFAAPQIDRDALLITLRQGLGDQPVRLASNRDLRQASLEIFDRTFLITSVLRLLAMGVAFVGVLSALMALELERARELGVLRASGLTPRQVWGLVTAQTGLIGFIAGLLAIPLGIVLATLLVHVINRRSFGWTLQLEIAPSILIQAVLLALAAALLAGLYPAFRMSRATPALALREE